MLKYTANSFYHEFLASANGCGIEACKCPVINDGQPQKSPNGIETAKSPPFQFPPTKMLTEFTGLWNFFLKLSLSFYHIVHILIHLRPVARSENPEGLVVLWWA